MKVNVPGSAYRRHHEQDLGALAVERRVDGLAGDVLQVLHEKLDVAHDGLGLEAHVVALHVAVGNRPGYPFRVQAQQVQQLAAHEGDLGLVYAVGAEHRAAAALRALVEVVMPFLDDVLGEVARAHQLAEQLAGRGEVAAVHRAQQLRAHHRHVLGVARALVEVALVGAGTAAHAHVHVQLERAVLLHEVFHAVEDDVLPALRQVPVLVGRRPVVAVRHAHDLEVLRLRAVAVHALLELGGRVHPARLGHVEGEVQKLVLFR